jgi:prepilin-type N-terminal cleavage/methylation domain-containing protein
MIRTRLAGADGEAGFTLVELLVAMFILGLLLTIVGGFYYSSVRLVDAAKATSQSTNNASTVMNELSDVIRSGTQNPVVGNSIPAPALVTATPESITVYSYVNSYVNSGSTAVRPLLVQFSLNASRQLVEKRWAPTSSSGGYFIFPAVTATPTNSNIIGGPILATPSSPAGSLPLFTYLDNTGAAIVVGGSGLTATQLATVVSIEVTVRIAGASTSSRPNVVLQNTVGMPNLGATS